MNLYSPNLASELKSGWRGRDISPQIKSISLGISLLSDFSLTDKELLEQALDVKYLKE